VKIQFFENVEPSLPCRRLKKVEAFDVSREWVVCRAKAYTPGL
jgi:hypothetical protein